jgi:hypothetical protein
MVRKFSINLVKFQDKYLDAIKTGIKLKYKELYPNNKITIRYNKNICDDIYRFGVYINLKIISKEDKNVTTNTLSLLECYTNIEAINIFSNISMEEYLEKYDDGRKNYKSQLIEFIEGIMVTYKLMGVNFKNYIVNDKRYVITIDSQHLVTSIDHSIIGLFQYDILTKREFENIKTKITGELQSKIRYVNGKSI